ncbi:hypothetical protein IW492_06075 [Enterococcus sp. BWB1-3]|uniref:hypothetical protein n=1 Tax=unclassified Enterococcus TaxID=2608891 RepID=UPI0019231213|nr:MULTISPECIES: hypothetical protein [unclassified Enterococcus]MBL1228799.1 hypothetical protein [Enterococcus sp. BWB1-3]MCB5953724.1 hypothetical protein [Enterococcus sp. CWB-B31]
MNKRIGIIGNNLSGDLAASLLKKKYEVLRFTDQIEDVSVYPFFGNDLKTGIMKQFFEDTVEDSLEIRKNAVQLSIVLDKEEYVYEMNIQSFQKKLENDFPKEVEGINYFFSEIERIGIEWSEFITSRFDGKKVKFSASAKYYNKNVEEVIEYIGIQDPTFIRIIKTLIPVKEVTFSVFAGYLYTQFFDICALPFDALAYCQKVGKQSSEQRIVHDISELKIEKFSNDTAEFEETMDAVIDLRQVTKSSENSIKVGYLSPQITLASDTLYLINQGDQIITKVWNSQLLNYNAPSQWCFEGVSYNRETISMGQVEECLTPFVTSSSETEVVDDSKINQRFDVVNGAGYAWAFSKKESLKDPTNLIRKHTSTDFSCTHWGFAWFSAAYHILNVVDNQMNFTSDRYKISEMR